MEFLTGGRQSGQNLYNALKLYNYIDSLQNDTTVRVVKKDGICCLFVDKSISTKKIKDKIKELNSRIEKYREYVKLGIETDIEWADNVVDRKTVKILQELLEESE